jgi:hypothetical protein
VALLVVFIGLLAWLNGPGWRWIGGIAGRQILEKKGLSADYELQGTLLGGIRVESLSLSGGPIRKLEIGVIDPRYELSRVIRGELQGVSVESIDAVIDLAADPLPSSGESGPPADDLPTTLAKVREMLLPMNLRAADLRFTLVRGAETLVDLGTTTISHEPGSDGFRLDLGRLAVGPGHAFDAQESVIRWTDDQFELDRFFVTPRVGVTDVAVKLPPGAAPVATGVVVAGDSRLVLREAGPSSARVVLEGAPLDLTEAAKEFAYELPVAAVVRRLDAGISGFDRSPDQWEAELSGEIGDLSYDGWEAESLELTVAKDGSRGTAGWTLRALDAEFAGAAELRWRDLAAGAWADFEASVRGRIPQLAPLVAAMDEKTGFAPAGARPLPPSTLGLEATVDSSPDGLRSAKASLLLSAGSGLPSIAADATWLPDGALKGTLGTDGLGATYALDFSAGTYQAAATLDSFRPEKLAGWAAAAGVALPTGMTVSGAWDGSGDLGAEPHRGRFDIGSFEWVRPDMPPMVVRAKGDYDWPREVEVEQLSARSEGQTIEAVARYADSRVELSRIEWKDGETLLVKGRAEVPVPAQPVDARAFLRQDEPLNLFLESEWIDQARLAAWLPEEKSPLASGSGRVRLVVTGTPAVPKILLETNVRGLSLRDQPDVPVTDANVTLEGDGAVLTLAGEIRPAGYQPVVLSGRTAFKPGLWAENPEAVLEEKLEARAVIPRLELGTFAKFVPQAEELAGTLEGQISAGGTLGQPDLGGELRLSNAAISLADSPAPPVSKANAVVRLEGKTVRLASLSLESAGGTLTGSGTVGIENTADPTFDLALRGTALPLKRDESMIVRADANLALRGTLKQAAISGSVEVVDSLFYRDFEILPVRMPFNAPSRPSLPAIDPEEKAAALAPPLADWTLDVRVRTRDPLLIRGNLAEGSATANVRFGGTLGNIQPQGNAFIRSVEARLPFSTLTVNHGAVVFTPSGGLNPELNIRGSSTIGRYEVNVFFYGPVDAPKTALTSDPPLPESEIMTLLATGTTSDGLEDGQAATMKAAQLLIEEWRRGRLPFAEQVAEVLEVLNRVDVRIGEDDPLTGRRLNSATIEVTEKIHVSGSVDKQSNTRVLGAFVLRFK